MAADASRLGRTGLSLVDSRGYADLALDNVAVGADAVLGAVDGAFPVLDAIFDRPGRTVRRNDGHGGGQAFTMLVDYLKPGESEYRVLSGPRSPGGANVHGPAAGPILRGVGAGQHRQ